MDVKVTGVRTMKRRGEGSESGRKKGLKMCEVNDGINMKMLETNV